MDIDSKKIAKDLTGVFKVNFIDNIEFHPNLKYADTDSTYNILKIPFNKYDNSKRTVDYSQKVAKDANIKYRNIYDTLLQVRANINPAYNFMDFKSEVVAYRGFFNTKKFYALAKIWMEGTFYKELEIKKTGGQILKADCSDVTFNLLTEIYKILTIRTDLKSIQEIKKIIFHDIKQKYIKQLGDSINNFRFREFVIPKKWPLSKKKTIPMHVKGAMLYNYLFNDKLRPGDSISLVQIKISKELLLKHVNKKPITSKYQLPMEFMDNKLNIIAFPSDSNFDESELNSIKKLFEKLHIKIDYDRIININIDMKIVQFEKLFKENIYGK
jgi:hypothetical protein